MGHAFHYLPTDPAGVRRDSSALVSALIDARKGEARKLASSLIRYHRGQGNAKQAKEISSYLAWMGYPFSEGYWINQAKAFPSALWAREIMERHNITS